LANGSFELSNIGKQQNMAVNQNTSTSVCATVILVFLHEHYGVSLCINIKAT